jgi:hypothetical protein
VKYYGGNPRHALVKRRDGNHKTDTKIGKSVPPEVVETSSLALVKRIVREGKLVQPEFDLKLIDFGQSELTPLSTIPSDLSKYFCHSAVLT